MKKMIGASSISFALALFFLLSSPALAFLGPGFGQNPGEGGGLFTVDSSKNIGFGTQTPAQTYNFDASSTQSGSIQHGYIFLVASSSNPGIGLRNTSYNSGQAITYLWSVRDFGALQLYREGGALPGKAIFHITPLGKVGVSTFTIDEGVRFQVGDGDIKAPGFQGSGVNLTDIDPTSFIANSAFPSGNFAFPGALAVGTTTVTGLPANGLYVQGNVGIGTISPTTALDVVGEVRAEGTSGAFNLISRDGSGTAHSLYNPTGDDVRFWNSIAGDTLTILNGGKVGIGTTSPALSLEVGGTTGAPAITGTAQTGALRIVDKTLTIGNVLDFGIYNSGAYGLWLQGTDRGNLATTYPIILQPNGGNVGIGNTVPGAKLEVTGQVKITGGTPGAGKVLTSDAAGLATWTTPVSAPVTSVFGRTGAVVAASGDYSVAQVTGAAPLASPTFTGSVTMSGNLTLSGTSANIILGSNYLSGDGEDEGIFVHGSTGNIGIGTTGPMAMLSVGIPGASNASISAGGKDYGILANGALVGVRGNGGTYGVYADGAVYDFYAAGIAGKNAFMGDVGIGLSSPEAGLHVNKSGGFRQSSLGEFNIDASGVIGGRMKVTTAGTVYFQNLTTDTATGAFVCIGAAGEIYKKGTVCVGISSLRYKENVTDLTYGLSEVMHLSPKFFTLKKEVFPQSGRRQVGLIAESVYPVIPEVVELDKDGLPESINYDAYTAVLTKAIQEQQVQIQELKSALCGIKPKLELCK